jgi:acyl carrier protein phosphodiesterase
MNHLAHAVLAGDDPARIVGGLLGDFWRGSLPPDWPAPVAAGVRLHRHIDSYTDAHPATCDARARFEPPFRRYAGILLDVWFDHLLAVRLDADGTLRTRLASIYAALAEDAEWWPPPFRIFASRLRLCDGLGAYRDRDHLSMVLERIAARLTRANPVGIALPALEALEAPLARDFDALWADLCAATASWQGLGLEPVA